MMNINFWDNWDAGYRRTFQFFGVLAIAGAVLLLIASWRSPAPTITWQSFQEITSLEKPVHQFETGPFQLQTIADNTVITEKLLGNDFLFQEWPAYFYLAGTLLGFILLLTVHSTVSRFWYMIGAGMLIFMVSGLQLELLYVLGWENQYAAIFVMCMLIFPGLAFQYYFQSAGFINRLLTYCVAVIGSFGLLAFLSEAPKPIYFIAINFIPATVVASVLLAIFTAHEIIAAIIYVITRGLKNSNALAHVSILSLIYLINLIATYLNDQTYLSWDYSLNPVLLIIVSGILSIWGIRRMQDQMDGFLLYGPAGPLAIVGLCVIAFTASTFFYTTGNDAAIDTIRNMGLYAHIGFGVIFLLYVIANFGQLLKDSYPVTKILYKPKSMPYFTFRLAGAITMLGFILYNYYQVPLNNTRGARYAAMGDYYIFCNNVQMAKGYYESSERYAFHNHHANFILANIENARGNTTLERKYYLNAAERRPTEQAYMNAVNTLDQNAINIYAYMTNVLKDFPRSGAANNAMGLVYSKFNEPDSAIYFFNRARKDRNTASTAEINLLATAIKQNLNLNVDSVYKTIDEDATGALSNAFALANSKNITLKASIIFPEDTVLNLYSAGLLSNYLINQADSIDTTFLNKTEKLARLKCNNGYSEMILTAFAHAVYKNGLVDRAFKIMQEITMLNHEVQGKNNNTMALWALDQAAPSVALAYAQYAVNQGYTGALLTNAIALTESERNVEAIVLLDSIKKTAKAMQQTIESIQRILGVNKKLVSELSDLEKYAYCRYRLDYYDSTEFVSIVNSIQDPNWKVRTILDRSKRLLGWDELSMAISAYNLLNGVAMSDKRVYENVQHHELLMAAANGNINLVQTKINNGILWPRHRESERIYYSALIDFSKNDTLNAKQKFRWLANSNSFFVDGILASAYYAKQNSKDKLESYTILATALQNNPQSVRLLKAYYKEAMAMGFEAYAESAKETLKQVLPESLFLKFNKRLTF